VLDEVRFWVYVLSKGSGEMNLFVGSNVKVVIMTTPLFATVDRGIEGDYRRRMWREKPSIDFSEKVLDEAQVSRDKDK
jgi:hypothetical protein